MQQCASSDKTTINFWPQNLKFYVKCEVNKQTCCFAIKIWYFSTSRPAHYVIQQHFGNYYSKQKKNTTCSKHDVSENLPMILAANMVRMLSQNDILSDTENQAVNTGGLANTDN